jgi:hypothetical protein
MADLRNEERAVSPHIIWVLKAGMKSAEHLEDVGVLNNTYRSLVVTPKGL